jgi:hypothetical protein
MKGLRTILGDSVKHAGGPRRAEELGCLELWSSVVGEKIADATRAERLRDGILFVVARSSVWAYELTFVKEEIIRSLNERLGRPLIRDIRFKTGAVVAPSAPEISEPAELPKKRAEEPTEDLLTERARAQVESAVAAIADERVRERTRKTLVRQALRREQKQKQGWSECPRCGALRPAGQSLCPLCRLRIKT